MTKATKRSLFPFLIIVYEIALYLSNDMYLPSMPAIAKDLSFSQHEIQSTLTFWFLGASSLQFVLGPISDRYGRRIIIIAGGLCFTLSSAVCAMANSLSVLIMARFIQGISICTLVAVYAAVHELYNTKDAIKLLALVGAVTILAPAFGPLIGSLIIQFADWRYIFWVLFGLGTLSLASIMLYMPETNLSRKTLHFKSIVSDYAKIMVNPNFLKPCGCYFFLVSVQFIWIFESPFIMIELYNTSTLFYGIAQTFIFSCFFIGAAATKWLLDRYSVQALIRYALGITVVGMLVFWAGSIYYPTINMAIISMMIISLGSSMLFGPFNRMSFEACKQPIGMITAVFTTSTSLAGTLTGVVLSLVNSRTLFTVATLSMMCIVMSVMLMIYTKIPSSVTRK